MDYHLGYSLKSVLILTKIELRGSVAATVGMLATTATAQRVTRLGEVARGRGIPWQLWLGEGEGEASTWAVLGFSIVA